MVFLTAELATLLPFEDNSLGVWLAKVKSEIEHDKVYFDRLYQGELGPYLELWFELCLCWRMFLRWSHCF